MRNTALLAATLLLLSSTVAEAQMGGGQPGGGPPGGGAPPGAGPPGGAPPRPPRPPKPIKRERFDEVVTAMFRKGDTNRDGLVALPELRALIESDRDKVIRARFARVDSNRNGSIDADEFLAWQKAMGSVAADEAGALGDRDAIIAEQIAPDAGDDPEDRMLAALIAPLNGIVVAEANTNYDAGVSLEELLAFEGTRFDAADINRNGSLSIDEMRPQPPAGARPPGGPGGNPPPCPPGQSC